MQFKLSVVAALAAAASAAVTPARLGCGTHDPTPEHIEISKKLAEEEAANNGTMSLMAAATINVNVYFHVVASSQTVANGYITVSIDMIPYACNVNV